ncbi:MAG TPA: hypothetical protein VFI38_08535 [Candidatus Acidoferrum sp.]|nr:hypothetical protein [Candidatus Acidoferrum sp.]
MSEFITGELAAKTGIVAVYIEGKTRRGRSLPADAREGALLMLKGDSGHNRGERREATAAVTEPSMAEPWSLR